MLEFLGYLMTVLELQTLCSVEMAVKTYTTESPVVLLYDQTRHIFMKLHSDLLIYFLPST